MRLRDLTPGQWVLRMLMVLAPVAALAATGPAGAPPRPWLVVVVLGLAVTWAFLPETVAGSAALVVVVCWWGIALRDGLQPEAVPAALALVAAHVAGLLAAYGPADLPLDPAVAWRWAWRGLAVFAPVPALWLAAAWLRDQPEQPGVWVTALAGAAAAAVVAAIGLTRGAQ